MENYSSRHCLTKEFYCYKCNKIFKKFVNIIIKDCLCPKCNFNCHEYFNNNNNNFNNDNNNNNNNDDNFRKHLENLIKPFTKSPFHNSIKKNSINNFDFNYILDNELIITPSEFFFKENYSSNFISNFINPMSRIVFISLLKEQMKNTIEKNPLSIKQIKYLNIFDLNENYCQKINNNENNINDNNNNNNNDNNNNENNNNNNNEIELPNCMYCLRDILINSKTVLLKCGHLFHENCVMDIIKNYSNCPLCKFEMVRQLIHKSSIDIINEKEAEENEDINKVIKINEENNKKIIKFKLNSDKNLNINILGNPNNNIII